MKKALLSARTKRGPGPSQLGLAARRCHCCRSNSCFAVVAVIGQPPWMQYDTLSTHVLSHS